MSVSNTSNFTVKWQPTPDLPMMGSGSDCDHGLATGGASAGNDPRTTPRPVWNETLADGNLVCTLSNSSYVYPCCEAMGIEARFSCNSTVCRIDAAREGEWYQCADKLANEINDQAPLKQCEVAKFVDQTPPNNHAAKQVPAIPLAIVVFLAAAAVVLQS